MDTTSGERQRHASTTRGGIVMVSLYSWTCVAVGITFVRLIIASLHKLEFGYDDGAVLAGMFVYLGSTVCWQYAVNEGLGKHMEDLRPGDAGRYLKSLYAAQMLEITAIALAKLSTVFLIDRVVSESHKRRVFLLGMVCLWYLYFVFVYNFQCGLPEPWKIVPHECSYGGPLLSAIALGMLVDVILGTWIFPIMLPLTMAKSKVVIVSVLFGARLIVPLLAIGQAWSVARMYRSDDPTWTGFELAIFFQAVSSLSLIVAHLPRIKRFLDVRGSGVLINARITENELSHRNTNTESSSSRDHRLTFVPTSSTRFTTTVESGNKLRPKERLSRQHDWPSFLSIGTPHDDNASISSLCDHPGVMLHQEVTVEVEDIISSDRKSWDRKSWDRKASV